MTISLGNALKSVKEDEQWIKKVVIGGIVAAITTAGSIVADMNKASIGIQIAGIILYLVFAIYLTGFAVSTANKQINSDSNTLAEWADSSLFLKGLKYFFSYIVYAFVITILFSIFSIIITIISAIALGLIYYLINLVLPLNQQFITFIISVIFIALMIVIGIYFMQFINAGTACYYKNNKFHDIMALKKQFRMIKENQHAAWTLFGKEILYALLFILVLIIACLTFIGIILVPFICFTAYIVLTNLYAQYAKEIEIGKYID